MIRTLIFLGLWAALPTPGQVGSAALYTEFENNPAPAVLQALQEEVDFLTAPNALHFEWRSLHENDRSTWPELAVVKFSGRCEILPSATPFQPGQRLGWTHISDGVILPFAEIDCDAIFAYLLQGLRLKPPQTRERILGRALARVTVHELLHILAGTIAHSDHGVDHPTLAASQLLAGRMDFPGEPTAHIVHAGSTPIHRSANRSEPGGEASYLHAGCANCHGAHGEGTTSGPRLRGAVGILNSVTLAAKLAKNQETMCQRARCKKLPQPLLEETEISGLVRFLNAL
jgi:cytochrome c553